MSSHHFVREGQEPALFIVEASALNNIESLLEWAPLVMVLDTALDTVLSWGIKIDAVLTRLDNLVSVEEQTHEQFPLQIFSYGEDEEPLVVGLQALERDQQAVQIICPATDHIFKLLENIHYEINIVLLDGDLRWVPVSRKFEKWLPAKTNIFVRKNADQEILYSGIAEHSKDLFESVADGLVMIQSDFNFWIAETIN
jgi:hypothetical protein